MSYRDDQLNRSLEYAWTLFCKEDRRKFFHITAIWSKRKLMTIGTNDLIKHHPKHRFGVYNPTKAYRKKPYVPGLHSEIAALIKLGELDTAGYDFVNVRLDKNGTIALSKPCLNCMGVLSKTGYKTFWYSTSEGFKELED